MPPGWGWRMGEVDAQGYVIPYATMFEKNRPREPLSVRQMIERRPTSVADLPLRYFYYAAGIIPPEVQEGISAIEKRNSAYSYPVIPAWLGDNLPLFTMFLPNGEVYTCGELGLHYVPVSGGESPMDQMFPPSGETWYHYDAQGKLLETIDGLKDSAPGDWLQLVNPELSTRLEADMVQAKATAPDYSYSYYSAYGARGLIQLPKLPEDISDPRNLPPTDMSKAVIIALYNIDGSTLDPDQPIEPAWGCYHPFPRDMVEPIYRAQVELGLTQAGVPSPYAGTPQGPVAVDCTPHPRPLLAQVNGGGVLRVRDLDDPQNPYRGQYDPWDYWLVGNADEFQAELSRRMNEQMQQRQEQVKKLKTEGKAVPRELTYGPYYSFDQEDSFKSYNVEVDPQGWVIPQRVLWQEELDRQGGDLRLPYARLEERANINTGGEMPPELLKQHDDAKWALERPTYPPIPPWLAQQPVFAAFCMPNGEVVTWGALGCRPADMGPLDPKTMWNGLERGYFRYSAQGELLDKVLTDEYDWLSLYFPGYVDLKNQATSRGQRCYERQGYVLIEDPVDGRLLEAYDYDGTPLDISQPLRRAPGYCNYLDWATIAEVYQRQQAAK